MSRARRLVILGGGDVTRRYLLPAVGELVSAGHLPDPEVVVVDRSETDDESYRRDLAGHLEEHAGHVSDQVRARVVAGTRHHTADVTDGDALRPVFDGAREPDVVHLALPPDVFSPTVEALAAAGIPDGSRVVVEKPFGTDLASAQRLNGLLDRCVGEALVFRMDHFLGEQTVRNLLGLRFANRLLAPLWSAEHVAAVEIVWDETVALEGRAGFYDETGALRDMVQSHLLQLLALVAMDEPQRLDAESLRDAKVAALERVRVPSAEEVDDEVVRARYTAGRAGDTDLPDYAAEEGVDSKRGTETFVELTLHLEGDRWAGVPFRLRTGKALDTDRHQIRIRFRPTPAPGFDGLDCPANELLLTMDPDRIALRLATNGSGDPFRLEHTTLEAELARPALGPYASLLLDALDGETSLSVRGDEAEACWRIVDPILAAWADGASPLREYPAGATPDDPAGWPTA